MNFIKGRVVEKRHDHQPRTVTMVKEINIIIIGSTKLFGTSPVLGYFSILIYFVLCFSSLLFFILKYHDLFDQRIWASVVLLVFSLLLFAYFAWYFFLLFLFILRYLCLGMLCIIQSYIFFPTKPFSFPPLYICRKIFIWKIETKFWKHLVIILYYFMYKSRYFLQELIRTYWFQLHLHPLDMDPKELFPIIPKEFWPKEYSGDLPSESELHQETVRKYYEKEKFWRMEESIRKQSFVNVL